MIPESIIEEIRLRADIVDIIGSRVTLKHAGGLFKGRCPFHSEKTPSFTVYPDEQNFHCFGCQAHGNVFTFLMKHEGLTFIDAVKLLAQRTGVELREDRDPRAEKRRRLHEVHASLAEFYHRCLLNTAEAAGARRYLEERGLGGEVLETFHIGYAPRQPRTLERWAEHHAAPLELLVEAGLLTERDSPPSGRPTAPRYYERFRGRLMFPIRDSRGRVIAFSGRILNPNARAAKYVNSPESLLFHKGSTLYALDLARAAIVKHPHREALVCEGQIDVIRCHARGFPRAVAAQGTAFTAGHVDLLKRYADSVVIVFDADPAGRKAAIRAAGFFLQAGMAVRIATLPDGEDPDSYLRREGPERFAERIEQAESIAVFMVKTLQNLEERPNSVDATDRIARRVLEMLSACDNAVQRARLVQEAAQKLNLPEAALHEELARSPVRAPAPARRVSAPSRTAEAPGPARPDGSRTSQAAPPPSASAATASDPAPEELALCELICQHAENTPLLDLVARYLPPRLAVHESCRAIVAAGIITARTGRDALMQLQEEGSAEVRALIDRLATSDHRMASARESIPEEAVRHCILRLWRRHLALERARIARDEKPGSTNPLKRRMELTTLMKRLDCLDWDGAEAGLRQETERLEKTPTP